MNGINKIFLDLDGVLTDFVGGIQRYFGSPLIPYPEGVWNFVPDYARRLGITEEAFWGELTQDFWANLEWTADGIQILDYLERRCGGERICLLTSAGSMPEAAAGKLRWVSRRLWRYEKQVMVAACKHFAAAPDAMLIDDSDDNVMHFIRAGGKAVLLPRPWNSKHNLAGDAVAYLDTLLSD